MGRIKPPVLLLKSNNYSGLTVINMADGLLAAGKGTKPLFVLLSSEVSENCLGKQRLIWINRKREKRLDLFFGK